MKEKKKMSLLLKLIIAIVLGIVVGFVTPGMGAFGDHHWLRGSRYR